MIACIPANLNAISLTSAASLSTNDLSSGQESISTRAVIYTNWPQTSRLAKEGKGGKKKIRVDLDPWASYQAVRELEVDVYGTYVLDLALSNSPAPLRFPGAGPRLPLDPRGADRKPQGRGRVCLGDIM
ncbi:Uncharacterized protein HZ326_12386 [Fusarium oxysporum f. sp. albedinis]|nr:Uncharacterized protein HZ326_12386 [Fusarium oxysporum f. sp. albedinis]